MTNQGFLSTASSSIRFLSWNIKGAGHQIKRSKVLSHLKHLKADIVFLQETHMLNKDHFRLHKPWVGQMFHSTFNSKSRGVAILIHKRIQFTATSTILDPHGRYLIITGLLFQTPVLLVNVYAPHFDNPNFANNLLNSLPNLNTHLLIFGGDLNCAIDPLLDRSNPRNISPSAMSKTFSDFMKRNGYIDPWRCHNPNNKEFSFFSHVHHSYSRIDYFFIDSNLLPNVSSSEYQSIIISDHAPVTLDLSMPSHGDARPPWKLNPLLMSDNAFCDYIASSIDTFLFFNKTETTSHSLIWETMKAYLRGQIISYSAKIDKEQKAQKNRLTNSIRDLDRRYATNPRPELYKERMSAQTEFNLLTSKHEERMLQQSRGNYYEYGEKASRLLAHQLKQQTASRLISQIKDNSNNLLTSPTEINATFELFYSTLYKSHSPTNSNNMKQFFDKLQTPTIAPDIAKKLDAPLNLTEITKAIKEMQNNKSPGPDGYPAEFFFKFCDKLAPLLLDTFNESFHLGKLPPTLTQASISLLLKKDKDPTQCGSYRPISLLNVDGKVLAKVLSSRIETVIPDIISETQTGFIKGRYSFFNIRTLMNIIYSDQSSKVPEIVISLDAEKAFDRVEWEYLFSTLKIFGFPESFIAWIRLLYTDPQSCVCTNNTRSKYFTLSRGTRQGCPLSPLLFAIAIEPLSITLRTSPLMQGIRRGDVEHRISLYADDLLLYVGNPMANIPNIISILDNFSSFSGYKLNYQKSVCFPVNSLATQLKQADIPFSFSQSGFKYLGVNITRSYSALFSENFDQLITQTKKDLLRWNKLPLTLTGRINSVKMTILPKFLYLFQSIPIFLPKSFFQNLNKLISSFIWADKRPRINIRILQDQKQNGGLALPNFLYYYWAANIHKLLYWYHTSEAPWSVIEETSCTGTSLSALLCSPYPSTPVSRYSKNPIVIASLKSWFQFRRYFKFSPTSTLGPVSANHLFPPSTIDTAFSLWKRKGIRNIRDLYYEGIFSTFEHLLDKYNLPRHHQFRYFQIRNFVKSQFPEFPSVPALSPWEELFKLKPSNNSLISHIHGLLMTFGEQIPLKSRSAWEEELGRSFEDDWWREAISRINSTTSCARLGLIQFKVFHRLHYSKARLTEIFPELDDKCDRCSHTPANLSHMFYFCPKLQPFWETFFRTLSTIWGVDLQPCPQISIFGVPKTIFNLNNIQKDVISFSSLIARRRILLYWKSTSPPTINSWIEDMMKFIKLEKIKFTLRGSSGNFLARWQPFLSHIDNMSELPE